MQNYLVNTAGVDARVAIEIMTVALFCFMVMPDTRHRGYLTADESRHLEPGRA